VFVIINDETVESDWSIQLSLKISDFRHPVASPKDSAHGKPWAPRHLGCETLAPWNIFLSPRGLLWRKV